MIVEINLLPKKLKEAARTKLFIAYGIIGVIGLGVAAGYVAFMQSQKNASIEEEIKSIESESAGLQDKIDMVRKFKDMEEKYLGKKAIVDGLLREQSTYTELLDRLAEMTPADMWIDTFTEQKQKEEGLGIEILANATSKMVLADFIKRIEQSNIISDIKVLNVKDGSYNGIKTLVFTIDFFYKTK